MLSTCQQEQSSRVCSGYPLLPPWVFSSSARVGEGGLSRASSSHSQPGSSQAIQSRDGVQLQYSQSLIEKDQYRKRVRALEEERDELLSKLSQAEGLNSTLEAQLQRCRGNRSLGKVRAVGRESRARRAGLNFFWGTQGDDGSLLSQMCSSSYSLCSNLSSTWSLADNPAGFASGLVDALGDSAIQSMVRAWP